MNAWRKGGLKRMVHSECGQQPLLARAKIRLRVLEGGREGGKAQGMESSGVRGIFCPSPSAYSQTIIASAS